MDRLSHYLTFWPVAAGLLVFLVLALVLLRRGRGISARCPQGISWVRDYGQGRFSLAQGMLAPKKICWPWLVLTAVFALAFSAVTLLPWQPLRAAAAIRLCTATLGGIGAYLLLQRLFGAAALSVCGGMLFAGSITAGHSLNCLLVVSLLLLLLWLARPLDNPHFWRREPAMWGAYLTLGLFLGLDTGAWLLLPLYGVIHVARLICLARRRVLSGGSLAVALLLAVVFWALSLGAYIVGMGLLWFGTEFPRIWQIVGGGIWTWLRLLPHAISLPSRSMALYPMIDSPLFAMGLVGLIPAFRLARDRRDTRGLLAMGSMGAGLAVWLATGAYILPAMALPAVGCLWAPFGESGRKGPMVTVTVLALIYDLALYIAAQYGWITVDVLLRIL